MTGEPANRTLSEANSRFCTVAALGREFSGAWNPTRPNGMYGDNRRLVSDAPFSAKRKNPIFHEIDIGHYLGTALIGVWISSQTL